MASPVVPRLPLFDDPTPAEEWRPVVGYEGLYEVSSLGRVASILFRNRMGTKPRRLILKSHTRDECGHQSLTLCKNGTRRTRDIHQIVALAFLGPAPSPRHVVAHWDGDARNNALSNLRWATYEENEADKRRHGRNLAGERNHRARLTAEQVRQIREREAGGEKPKALAAEFGVAVGYVTEIVRGDNWKTAPGPTRPAKSMLGDSNHLSKLTPEKVRLIRSATPARGFLARMARELGVSKATVRNVYIGKTWSHLP